MKNYEVSYTKGHLVDIKTGNRIYLKRGGKFFIQGDDDQFEERDELQQNEEPLPKKGKYTELTKLHPGSQILKIANAGTEFVFRIGLAKTTSEDKDREFFFKAEIHEDLYIRSKSGEKWVLCDCLCEVTESLDRRIVMFESVKGMSLNSLFANMVSFYFPMQRSTACNAFRTFIFADSYVPILNFLLKRNMITLETKRTQIINEIRKSGGIVSNVNV